MSMFPPELYQIALTKEFELSYYTSMGGISSWQDVPAGERDWLYAKMVDTKREEKKRADEEAAKLAAKTKVASSSR